MMLNQSLKLFTLGVGICMPLLFGNFTSGSGDYKDVSNMIENSNVKNIRTNYEDYRNLKDTDIKESIEKYMKYNICDNNFSLPENNDCANNSCLNDAKNCTDASCEKELNDCTENNCVNNNTCDDAKVDKTDKVVVPTDKNKNNDKKEVVIEEKKSEPKKEENNKNDKIVPEKVEKVEEKEKTQKTEPREEANSEIAKLQREVADLVNKERAKEGLAPLKFNIELSKVATIKSQDMIDKNYFSHTSPTYGSPFDMMRSFGIKFSTAGENIAYGQRSAAEVMNGWMNSPGHRKNILSPNYDEIGVGVAKDSNGTIYWTQMFIK